MCPTIIVYHYYFSTVRSTSLNIATECLLLGHHMGDLAWTCRSYMQECTGRMWSMKRRCGPPCGYYLQTERITFVEQYYFSWFFWFWSNPLPSINEHGDFCTYNISFIPTHVLFDISLVGHLLCSVTQFI